ncbi:unnamed protein product [Boreogadus saida]
MLCNQITYKHRDGEQGKRQVTKLIANMPASIQANPNSPEDVLSEMLMTRFP